MTETDYSKDSQISLFKKRLKELNYNPIIVGNRIYFTLFMDCGVFITIEVDQPQTTEFDYLFDNCTMNVIFFAEVVDEFFDIVRASDLTVTIIEFRQNGICSIDHSVFIFKQFSNIRNKDQYEVVAGPIRKILEKHINFSKEKQDAFYR